MTRLHSQSSSVSYRALLAAAALAISFGVGAASIAPNDPTDLSPTPPDLSSAVNPNIFVTFDDSGSTAWTRMGDERPFSSGATNTWNGPWRCANVVDPDHGAASDASLRRIAMNGVYYNPKTGAANGYLPPMKEDGSGFPNADTTLAAVPVDGIAVNRPYNKITAVAAAFNNNPDLNGGANDAGLTNLKGTKPVTGTDNRWRCGTGSSTSNDWNAVSPMDGTTVYTLSDGATGTYPNGGPYYYRFKLICGTTGAVSPNCAPATQAITLNAYGAPATAADVTKLYTVSNWEAVPVPTSGALSQAQGFANWYAYYRARNLLMRSALSRVFGVLGSPQQANIRVTWQNLGNNNNVNWTSPGVGATSAPAGTQIVELDDTTTAPPAAPYSAGQINNVGWRQAFFNWIYNVKANGGTPNRTALLRAGNYFTTGAGPVTNLTNPYWQPASGAAVGRELACRQNFHILMTDGLYNAPTASSPGSPTSSTWSLPSTPAFINPSGIVAYDPTLAESKIFAHGGAWTSDSDGSSTYSDIAFNYWATNLRPDFSTPASSPSFTTDTVPPYFPDLTTGITLAPTTVNSLNPGATPEVFWNPVNDPATWPHLVQYAVSLGAFGNLFVSNNTDCQNGVTTTNDDGCALRKGVANSSGSIGWPRPDGRSPNPSGFNGIPPNIDDLWHGALNGRGSFFVASSPQTLVTKLTKVLTNIVARSGSSAAESVSSSILNAGSIAYKGGYNSSGWPGFLYQQPISQNATTGAVTVGSPTWDAGCFLTGGACTATGTNVGAARNPTTRLIFTSVAQAGSLTGVPFQWASLPAGGNEAKALNLDPATTWPDVTTGFVVDPSSGTANGTADPNGSDRVLYLRGKRTNETTPTSTATPTTFRPRLSVLGGIVDSAAVFEGAPGSGWQDIYPPGSPEQTAAVPCDTLGNAAASCKSYEKFVAANLLREPMLYVGANDGMMHAFNASSGAERWGYVPNPLYTNGQLVQVTNPANGLIPTVDDSPILQDVFINGQWKTIMIGSLRLGGRGIYALDVTCTSPASATSCTPASEGAAAGQFMWEFSSAQDSDLGYTYASTNIARIRCNVAPCNGTGTPGGTWVVLVTSGYSPICLPAAQGSPTCTANGHPATNNAPGATTKAAGPTYLWVLNAVDGSLIAKIPTTAGTTTFGLGTPGVVDFGLDQLDDVAVAGDLAGNVWRFDLSSPNPANWSTGVDVIFKTYTTTTACAKPGNTTGVGCEPITVMPLAFADSVNGGVVYVFGSGQYLGASDNTTASVKTDQHFFGVRDYGTHYTTASDGGSVYPFHESDLNSRTLAQDIAGNRSLPFANTTTAANPRGWEIPLNVVPAGSASAILGERDVVTASPLFSAGIALLTSLIPGQNSDPCVPGRSGAIIAVNASTGGPPVPSTTGASTAVVGATVSNPPTLGGVSAISVMGGGSIVLPGITVPGGGTTTVQFQNLTPIWRRTSWNELLNQL